MTSRIRSRRPLVSLELLTVHRSEFIAPDVEYPFPTVLKPIRVPPGSFPIEVTQYWRGEAWPGQPHPLHWALVVRTSADHGNRHEVVGNTSTYATQARFGVPLSDLDATWRGSHVVGYVSPDRMEDLCNRIALTVVKRGNADWNCQNWVYDVLEGLNRPGLYADHTMTFAMLQTQMCRLLQAWEEADI